MSTPIRQRRDFDALERRRKHAARLFATGKLMLAAISRQLNVSRQSVSRWYERWKRAGSAGLKGAGRAGRKPRMDKKLLKQMDVALRNGARAHGFSTDLWTLPRVAIVIERVTGVHYHPGHVWKVLGAMDWTLQRPAKQARERKPEAVKYWVTQRWPEVKKTLAAEKRGSSSKTRAASRSGRQSEEPGLQREKPRS